MLYKLFDKLQSFEEKKLLELANNLPVPDLPERSRYIQEYDDNGLYVYNDNDLRYYGDDGTTWSLTDNYDENSWSVFNMLYDSNAIRIARPIFRTINGKYEICQFNNPYNECGVPFLYRLHHSINIDFWLEYFNNIKLLADTLEKNGCNYPNAGVNPYKYVTDIDGLFLNPIISREVILFTATKDEFFDLQYKQLAYLTFAFTESSTNEYIQSIDWELIRRKAREIWLS